MPDRVCALDDATRLVDQDGVGVRPLRGPRTARRPIPLQTASLRRVQQVPGHLVEVAGLTEQAHGQPNRVDRGPHGLDVIPYRPGPGHRVLDPVVGDQAGGLHPQQHEVGEALRQQRTADAIGVAAGAQRGDRFGHLMGRNPPSPRAARHDQRFGDLAEMTPHRPADDLGLPCVTLQGGHLGWIEPPDGHALDEFGDGDLADVHLPERGEHLADVVQEGAVGAHDEYAAAGQPAAVSVQQVRGTVQSDRGLAGPWSALDAHRAVQVGAHHLVLFRLDGGDDVTHRTDARPLDLLGEDPARDVGLRCVAEMLVLVGRDLAPGEPEPATQRDPLRVAARGPVEGARDVRAPVDDDGVAGCVHDVTPPDVERLRRPLPDVDAAEEQRHGRVVDQRPGPPVQRRLQVALGDRVPALGGERQRVFAHPAQVVAGAAQVVAFGREGRVAVRRHRAGRPRRR